MINTNRIVPVERVDLISLYGLILDMSSNYSGIIDLQATSIDGDFTVDNGFYLAAQPLKTGNFTDEEGTILFVADYAYEGFTVDGAAVTATGDEVNPDGCTLYEAMLSDGTVSIRQLGF